MKEVYFVSSDVNAHSDGLLTGEKLSGNSTIERIKRVFGAGTEVIFRTGSNETSIKRSESANPMVVFFGHNNRMESNLIEAIKKIGSNRISLFNISCYAKEGIEEVFKGAEISSEAFSTSGKDMTSLNGHSNVATALFGRRFKSLQDSQISKASIADWVLSCSHERSGVVPENNDPHYFIKTSQETICIDAVSYLQRYAEIKGDLQPEDEGILREVYRPIAEKWTSLHSDIEQLFMRKL